jgi:hypothetical protein
MRAASAETLPWHPSDEAATTLLYLALRNIIKRWKQAPRDWKPR